MWRHRLADDVVQVKTVWFQTFLLLLMETLQVVDCCTCPTGKNNKHGFCKFQHIFKICYVPFCTGFTVTRALLISVPSWQRVSLEINAVYCERVYTVVLLNKCLRTEKDFCEGKQTCMSECTHSRFCCGMSKEAAMLMRVGRQCRWWLWEWGRMVFA